MIINLMIIHFQAYYIKLYFRNVKPSCVFGQTDSHGTGLNKTVLFARKQCGFFTYSANSLKVLRVVLEVDNLAIKGPGKAHVQCWIHSYLAWQHNALAHHNLHAAGSLCDPARLCTAQHITAI